MAELMVMTVSDEGITLKNVPYSSLFVAELKAMVPWVYWDDDKVIHINMANVYDFDGEDLDIELEELLHDYFRVVPMVKVYE